MLLLSEDNMQLLLTLMEEKHVCLHLAACGADAAPPEPEKKREKK